MVIGRTRAEVQAEAATWLSRLHSTRKTRATEDAFRAWLAEHEDHRAAFEDATEIWDMLPSAAGNIDYEKPPANDRRGGRKFAIAASAVLLAAIATIGWLTKDPVYQTRVGEQQVVMLADSSRVALNTDTQMEVEYSPKERRIILERGEALFEVSKDPERPFLVVAGRQLVRAVGTKFIVRRDGDRTRVTLLEGKVQVLGPTAPSWKPLATLMPGQRLTVAATAGASLDTQSIESATAWRRGEVVFEDSSLLEVATEINRYSDSHLIIADPSLASKRVSGVFSTKDVGEVAKAIATLHDLAVERDGKDYKLKV